MNDQDFIKFNPDFRLTKAHGSEITDKICKECVLHVLTKYLNVVIDNNKLYNSFRKKLLTNSDCCFYSTNKNEDIECIQHRSHVYHNNKDINILELLRYICFNRNLLKYKYFSTSVYDKIYASLVNVKNLSSNMYKDIIIRYDNKLYTYYDIHPSFILYHFDYSLLKNGYKYNSNQQYIISEEYNIINNNLVHRYTNESNTTIKPSEFTFDLYICASSIVKYINKEKVDLIVCDNSSQGEYKKEYRIDSSIVPYIEISDFFKKNVQYITNRLCISNNILDKSTDELTIKPIIYMFISDIVIPILQNVYVSINELLDIVCYNCNKSIIVNWWYFIAKYINDHNIQNIKNIQIYALGKSCKKYDTITSKIKQYINGELFNEYFIEYKLVNIEQLLIRCNSLLHKDIIKFIKTYNIENDYMYITDIYDNNIKLHIDNIASLSVKVLLFGINYSKTLSDTVMYSLIKQNISNDVFEELFDTITDEQQFEIICYNYCCVIDDTKKFFEKLEKYKCTKKALLTKSYIFDSMIEFLHKKFNDSYNILKMIESRRTCIKIQYIDYISDKKIKMLQPKFEIEDKYNYTYKYTSDTI